MKRLVMILCVMFFVVGTAGIAFAGAHYTPPGPMDPKGVKSIHYAYENATFTPGEKGKNVQPGLDLAQPGDSYRYTIVLDDKCSNDPKYAIHSAIIGIHIDDTDKVDKWAKILIDGKTVTFKPFLPFDKRGPIPSGLIKVISDKEFSPGERMMPPYILNVTDLMKKNKKIVIEITNLRKDGSIDGNAPFGSFIINRIGCHVYYVEK